MEKFLVTGGAGFIGSNICKRLVSQDCFVRVVDNLLTGKKSNLAEVIDKIEFIQADMGDSEVAQSAMKDIDVVLHEGALPSVPVSVDNPAATHKHCVDATFTLLLAARDAGVKRFVYAASSSAYGDTPTLPKVETMPPAPLSPYALSKLTAEFYAVLFNKLYGLSTVSLRYFNLFGPGQDPQSQYAAVIPRFITALLTGNPPAIFGDGEQSRDFTYIEDCVSANLLACKAEGASGRVMNGAWGFRTTLNSLFKKIRNITGASIEPIYEASRPGDVKHSLADISQAKDLLKYSPSYSIDEGLKKTVEWFRT